MAKGGGSANKSFLFQETKAVLNPTRMLEFLDEKIRSLGTAACPPYHLAVVIGGTSAEFALKTAKYASAHYLDHLPTEGSMAAHGFRDVELEEEVFKLTQSFGIGAQFGGKYFCHDVRVVRLPRHGASCPVAIAVSCSADRQALGKITADGVFLEQLEMDPAQYMPDAGVAEDIASGEVVSIDLNQPMTEILAELSKHPVKTRLSLSGPLVVARDIAHAKIKERLDAGEEMPAYLRDHPVYYAGPAKTPVGMASGSFGPTTAGRMDSYVEQFQAAGGSMVMLAKGNRSKQVTEACDSPRWLLPRLDRRPRRTARAGLHQEPRGARVRRARHGGGLEDRGRGLPCLHRGRRQGQRLLHRPLRRGHGAAELVDGVGDPGAVGRVGRSPWAARPHRVRPHGFQIDSTRAKPRATKDTIGGNIRSSPALPSESRTSAAVPDSSVGRPSAPGTSSRNTSAVSATAITNLVRTQVHCTNPYFVPRPSSTPVSNIPVASTGMTIGITIRAAV